MSKPFAYKDPGAALPLDLGDVEPFQNPDNLVIGICHRCGRRGLLRKDTRNCTGYRAVTRGFVQVPVARTAKCQNISLRRMMRRRPKTTIKLPRRAA